MLFLKVNGPRAGGWRDFPLSLFLGMTGEMVSRSRCCCCCGPWVGKRGPFQGLQGGFAPHFSAAFGGRMTGALVYGERSLWQAGLLLLFYIFLS